MGFLSVRSLPVHWRVHVLCLWACVAISTNLTLLILIFCTRHFILLQWLKYTVIIWKYTVDCFKSTMSQCRYLVNCIHSILLLEVLISEKSCMVYYYRIIVSYKSLKYFSLWRYLTALQSNDKLLCNNPPLYSKHWCPIKKIWKVQSAIFAS